MIFGTPLCSPVHVIADLVHGCDDDARDMLAALQTAFDGSVDGVEDEGADLVNETCTTDAADSFDTVGCGRSGSLARPHESAPLQCSRIDVIAVAQAQAAEPAAGPIDPPDIQPEAALLAI